MATSIVCCWKGKGNMHQILLRVQTSTGALVQYISCSNTMITTAFSSTAPNTSTTELRDNSYYHALRTFSAHSQPRNAVRCSTVSLPAMRPGPRGMRCKQGAFIRWMVTLILECFIFYVLIWLCLIVPPSLMNAWAFASFNIQMSLGTSWQSEIWERKKVTVWSSFIIKCKYGLCAVAPRCCLWLVCM